MSEDSAELQGRVGRDLPDKAVLLSIKPIWADAILDGIKRWEYRKQPPAMDPPYRVILYASSPRQAAVGEAVIDSEVHSTPLGVADETVSETPQTVTEVLDYFGDRDDAYALRVGDASWFYNPVPLASLRQADIAPSQNFRYIDSDWFGPSEVAP